MTIHSRINPELQQPALLPKRIMHLIYHGVCFAGARLTVSETGHHSFIEEILDERLDSRLINSDRLLIFVESVIKFVRMIFNVLRDPIYLHFTFVNQDIGICS